VSFAYLSSSFLGQIYMKFCVRGQLADVINCAKFYFNQITSFDSVGSIFWLSHKKRKVAVNTWLEIPFSLWLKLHLWYCVLFYITVGQIGHCRIQYWT